MTQLAAPQIQAPTTHSRTLWRVAGGFALAHIVLMFAGFSQEVAVEHSTPLGTIMEKYGAADINRVFAGGYVESLSFIVLAVAVVLLGRLFATGTEVAKIAGQAFLALGVVYVAATLAVGFAPGAAAVYWSQHGADPHVVAGFNDLRNHAFVLQIAISMAMVGALGVAALSRRILVRWVGWLGVTVGALGLVVTPFAHNAISMVFVIWWVGLAVLCLRGGPRNA